MNKIGKIMLLGVFVFISVFGLMGCPGGTNTTTNTTTNNTSNTTRTTANNSTTTTTTNTTTTTTTTAEAIGVPECDDFLKKYEACVKGKVPEAARAGFNTSMEQWRSSWKKLAENPQTKGTLANACKQSLESAKASMSAYSCEW
jgi:hypothetical protein